MVKNETLKLTKLLILGDFAPNKDHWHKRKNSPDSDQIKGNFYEDNEDKEAIMNDRAEFLDRPRFVLLKIFSCKMYLTE